MTDDDNIVPLRRPPEPEPTLDELIQVVRDAAAAPNTENIDFEVPHFKERSEQRFVSMRQILETLRKGEGQFGKPKRDEFGGWRIRFRRVVAGRRVQVVVSVAPTRKPAVTAVTAI